MNRRFFLTLRLRSVQAFGWVAAALAFFFGLTFSAQASPRPQLPQYATPTPGPDGRIIYVVQAGDNCISISTKTGVSIELLLGYNPMLDCDPVIEGQQLLLGDGRIIYIVQAGDNCISISTKTGVSIELLLGYNPMLDCDPVIEGQQLLLGYGGPAAYTPTPGPSPTPTIAPLTPTPFAGTTEVCILLYDDFNGNALREGTELGLAGGTATPCAREPNWGWQAGK